MNFAYADFEEVQQHNDKVEAVYNRLISTTDEDRTLVRFYRLSLTKFLYFSQVYIQYMNFKRRTAGIKGARVAFKKAREDTKCNYQVSSQQIQVIIINFKNCLL